MGRSGAMGWDHPLNARYTTQHGHNVTHWSENVKKEIIQRDKKRKKGRGEEDGEEGGGRKRKGEETAGNW